MQIETAAPNSNARSSYDQPDLMPPGRDLDGLKCVIRPQQRRRPAVHVSVPVVIISLRHDDERRFGGFDFDVHRLRCRILN